jgi:hypothetical protein
VHANVLIFFRFAVLAAIFFGVQCADAAAIYKFRDRNGVVNYTNVRPIGVNPQIVMIYCPACDPTSKVDFSRVGINITAFDREIQSAISKHPVDEALVRAIIQAESAYNPSALSKAGAQGLMQLMPGTANQYGVTDSYNAAQNIQGGVAYLRFLLDFFDGDVRLASAGYNAGENNVLKYAGVPPFAETQVYVKRVAQLYQRYQGELAKEKLATQTPSPAAAPPTASSASTPVIAAAAMGQSRPVVNPSSVTASVSPAAKK